MGLTRTLIVDSSYLLKRSFDGAKNSYTKSGFMGGLYGFLTTVRMIIKDHQINKVILVWDGENGGIERYRLDNKYKSGRKNKSWYNKIELSDEQIRLEKEKEQSILFQKVKIQSYAEELFLRQIQVDETEADDLIAAYCIKNCKNEEIILFTNDQDFLQLLEYGIKIKLVSKKAVISAGNFLMYFPFFYKNALTIKILCGDQSDDIDGIKGIKQTTLLNNFPDLATRYVSVKEICEMADKINEDRKKLNKEPLVALNNIVKGVKRLKLNHQLMNLSKPFLNENALVELNELELPLIDENRGSSNLLKMMKEDDFLSLYSNYGNFNNYVEPFYGVIAQEKELYKQYKKNK